jgi:hypothetical protein
MARFKVVRSWRKEVEESEPMTHAEAHNVACDWLLGKRCKTLTVLRDSEGEDHPANAGKFFLFQIYK